MAVTVRQLADTDAEAYQQLGREAFGAPTTTTSQSASDKSPTELLNRPGRTTFGAFDGGRLAAQMTWRDYDSWFGGRLARTAGIAGVTVATEYRGRGLLSPLFAETLGHARDAGAVVSTLFPSAAGIYRRFGYELVSDYATVSLPTWVLASVRAPADVSTRRAEIPDVPAVRGVYDTWAAAQNGPLSRRGPSFPRTDVELLADVTATTVAIDPDGTIIGYASWNRGHGYGPDAVLGISELLALSQDGYRALLAALGSFGSVTPTTTIDTSGHDLLRLLLPTVDWKVTHSDPYMLTVLDVAGALTDRDYPTGLSVELTFALTGQPLTTGEEAYVLQVADGRASCRRSSTGTTDRVFTARGLALLYAGVQSCGNLRFAGLLRGGDVTHDQVWDGLFGGRPMHIRNYF